MCVCGGGGGGYFLGHLYKAFFIFLLNLQCLYGVVAFMPNQINFESGKGKEIYMLEI